MERTNNKFSFPDSELSQKTFSIVSSDHKAPKGLINLLHKHQIYPKFRCKSIHVDREVFERGIRSSLEHSHRLDSDHPL